MNFSVFIVRTSLVLTPYTYTMEQILAGVDSRVDAIKTAQVGLNRAYISAKHPAYGGLLKAVKTACSIVSVDFTLPTIPQAFGLQKQNMCAYMQALSQVYTFAIKEQRTASARITGLAKQSPLVLKEKKHKKPKSLQEYTLARNQSQRSALTRQRFQHRNALLKQLTAVEELYSDVVFSSQLLSQKGKHYLDMLTQVVMPAFTAGYFASGLQRVSREFDAFDQFVGTLDTHVNDAFKAMHTNVHRLETQQPRFTQTADSVRLRQDLYCGE
ncbi:MAG: hypothetical protein ACI8Y7_000884 [Candidatus Woesearchaeota archaeon]|jgi:hypothetical protein